VKSVRFWLGVLRTGARRWSIWLGSGRSEAIKLRIDWRKTVELSGKKDYEGSTENGYD